MASNLRAMKAMYVRLGFTAAAATALVTEQDMTDLQEFSQLSDKAESAVKIAYALGQGEINRWTVRCSFNDVIITKILRYTLMVVATARFQF